MYCPICSISMDSHRRSWLCGCQECGLLASTLEPSIVTEAEPHGAIDEARRATALDAVRHHNNEIILDRIRQIFGSATLEILDVGCGHGQFLKQAKARGHSVLGIEPDGAVAAMTRARTEARVLSGFFPQVLPADSWFDVILFNDVLEHLPEPGAILESCKRHLKAGGVIIANCPDRNGIFYRTADFLDSVGITSPYRRLWQVGLPSPHLWYFNAATLSLLGQRHGLKMIEQHQLLPVTRNGLWERISYDNTQSLAFNLVVYAVVWPLVSLISFLPKDSCVAYWAQDEIKVIK